MEIVIVAMDQCTAKKKKKKPQQSYTFLILLMSVGLERCWGRLVRFIVSLGVANGS